MAGIDANTDSTIHYEKDDGKILKAKKWPTDIIALALVTGHLWAFTFVWFAFDLDHLLSPPLHSEKDAWLLALSGIIFLYILLGVVIAAWGFILGIPTCLLAINLSLRHYRPLYRWLISVAATTAVFIALSHYGLLRYGLHATDKTTTHNISSTIGEPINSHDLYPRQKPVSVNVVNQEKANAAIIAMEKKALARCVSPKDPIIIDACAKQKDLEEWQQETGKVR